jgi:hypothetical protein
MHTSTMIQSLALFTLIGSLVIIVIAYLLFMRKRSNRHPVEKPELAGRTMAPTKEEPSS